MRTQTTPLGEPQFVVNGKILALMVGVWGLLCEARNLFAYFSDMDHQVRANATACAEIEEDIEGVTRDGGSVDRLEEAIARLSREIEAAQKDSLSARDRGFESEQNLKGDISRIDSAVLSIQADLQKIRDVVGSRPKGGDAVE